MPLMNFTTSADSYLPAICTALAERMGTSPLLLAEASTRNACELFNW